MIRDDQLHILRQRCQTLLGSFHSRRAPVVAELVRIGREQIFVIDSSGSMGGQSIVQAKAALKNALDRLRGGDLFNIVDFDSTTCTASRGMVPKQPKQTATA